MQGKPSTWLGERGLPHRLIFHLTLTRQIVCPARPQSHRYLSLAFLLPSGGSLSNPTAGGLRCCWCATAGTEPAKPAFLISRSHSSLSKAKLGCRALHLARAGPPTINVASGGPWGLLWMGWATMLSHVCQKKKENTMQSSRVYTKLQMEHRCSRQMPPLDQWLQASI